MAAPTDPRPSQPADPTPTLIERYRLRRDAWIAQADELARLRDEVRGSAEREAMEIVTRARQNVRQVVMEARRELLVLSAQVQAALGEASSKADPVALLKKAGLQPELGAGDEGFIPESAVTEILDEVQADMSALAEDARTLPLKDGPAERPAEGSTAAEPMAQEPDPALHYSPQDFHKEDRQEKPLRQDNHALQANEPDERTSTLRESLLSKSASKALLSPPFPSDAVPVPPGRSIRTFVSLFMAIGVVVVLATVWWVRGGGPDASAETAVSESVAEAAPVESGAAAVPDPTAPETPGVPGDEPISPVPIRATGPPRNLTVVAEAIGEVWVRTTVDGQSDLGRTLQAGQLLEVSADESIALRVGNAGALMVSVNNGERRPFGREGQVLTRQFLAEQPASPAPPAPRQPPTAAPTRPAALPPTVSFEPAQPASPEPPPVARAAAVERPAAPAPPPAQPTPPPASPTAAVPAAPMAEAPAVSAAPAVVSADVAPPAPVSPATAVVAAARQWLDAYHRQDRAAMAALATENMQLTDERRSEERLPPGAPVTRTLDRVSVQVAADTAVLTAVMTEQSPTAPAPQVSPVSQVWVLSSGQWKVRQARFVSEARLNQVFR